MSRWETIDDFGEDIIDSRDIIERIDELESDLSDVYEEFADAYVGDLVPNMDEWVANADALDTEEQTEALDELRKLREFADECKGYCPDWSYGATLILDSYFPDYAEQMAEDIGAIDRDAGWPLGFIDWEAAADALKMDYTEVSINGYDYWIR